MIGWLGAALAAAPVAEHAGRAVADGIRWRTEVRGAADVTFATPIAREDVRAVRVAEPRWEGDRLAGLDGIGTVGVVEVVQRGDDGLRPPWVQGAVQLADLDGAAFAPDPALGLVPHLGWSVGSELTGAEQDAALGALGRRRMPYGAVLVRVDGPMPDGLAGEVVRRRGGVVLAASVAVAVAVAALALVDRRLVAPARRERLAAWLGQSAG